MKKLIWVGVILALIGVGLTYEPEQPTETNTIEATSSTVEQTKGDIETDLKTTYNAEKVETMGQQLVVTMPFADASSESKMVFKSFHNMGNSLNYIMGNHADIEAKKIYYMYRAKLTDASGNTSDENLMGVIFNTDDLKRVYQGEDLPFQAYLPYADMDYKQPLGKKAVQTWCSEQNDKANYRNVCL